MAPHRIVNSPSPEAELAALSRQTDRPPDEARSGNKGCGNPLANVGGSRRRDATIASGAYHKAGPTRKIGCVHGLDRCRHGDEGRD